MGAGTDGGLPHRSRSRTSPSHERVESRWAGTELGYSLRHNFPSCRLRHSFRVWRYRRRHPWQFAPDDRRRRARDVDDILTLPQAMCGSRIEASQRAVALFRVARKRTYPAAAPNS